MAKLVDVYRPKKPLGRRQLQLVVDDNLTMIMDLNSSGLFCDNKPVRGKELDEMTRKFKLLSEDELKAALTVPVVGIFRILDDVIPCVGCRRSVERLHMQLWREPCATLDPLIINNNGAITFRPDKKVTAADLTTLFHGHSARLNKLIESQPRRSKKSNRCLLHSLDSQRSRPITPAWREVWDIMRPQCKEEVVLIEASTLHLTLENYLRKHRFCGECRTKVLKAYSLLVEEPDPSKEKGYVSALYSGIKRCLPDKHLHLQTKTEYINKLITRAEPELLGSRRERHAKTLEIAQEEVLTCLGICVYERLHKIYVRMREEECTCQVFAAIAVDSLCRNFEMAIENKQGISQLELLYEELTKEELLKQQRKEQKKLKRKRKKERLADEKENCNRCETPEHDNNCSCQPTLVTIKDKKTDNCQDCNKKHKENGIKSKDFCESCKSDKKTNKCSFSFEESCDLNGDKSKEWSSSEHSHDCGYSSENNNGCCENVSATSSLPSSPEGSEMACSGSCCNLNLECPNDYKHSKFFPRGNSINSKLSLQQMLDSCSSDEEGENSYIPPEEIRQFQLRECHLSEKREELRQTLRTRFAQLCVNGPQTVPNRTFN